ncbi:MAG: 50S ribosomal protein L18e [archaeon]
MKVTGPTNTESKKLVRELEKKYRKEKKSLWKVLAEKIGKARRKKNPVNLHKLNKLSKKFSNKTFVVAGKVLSYGELQGKINVIAFDYSAKAREKILEKKGNPELIANVLDKKLDLKELMIVE